ARGAIYGGKPTGSPDTLNERLVLRLLVARKFGKPQDADGRLEELLARQAADGGGRADPRLDPPGAALAGDRHPLAPHPSADGDESVKVAIERACKFLTGKQEKNGSWLVPTIAFHAPSNRPGRDKKTDPIYTYWGTAWATLGLLHTLPAPTKDGDGKVK